MQLVSTQHYPPLHVASPRPYYIVAPAYRHNSAGIRVMHMLCHLLNRCGQDAYLYSSTTNPMWHTPLLTNELRQQHEQAGRQPIVVYPEVVSGNPTNARSVVRYLLNVPGLIAGDTEFADSEMIFAYGEHLLPKGAGAERILFLPPIDTSLFNNLDNAYDSHRKGWLIYPGRHTHALQEHPELAARCTLITNEWPATPREMAELFRRSEGIYCFSSTATALEAMLCGCPAVVLKSPFFDGTPLGIGEFGTHGLAFEDAPEAIEHARSGLPIVQQKYADLQGRFWDQLASFIEQTQAMPCTDLHPDAMQGAAGGPDAQVAQWLRSRRPTDAQAALIAQRLEDRRMDLPTFDFVILPDGPPTAVQATRQSLQGQMYQQLAVHVPADCELATLNQLVLQQGSGQWLCFVRAGTTFTPFGLLMLALELLEGEQVRAVYADELVTTPQGTRQALLRPDFNLDMLLASPAQLARHWFYRREVFLEAGGFDPACAGAAELALLLHLIEDADGLDGLAHVSEPVCISPSKAPVHSPQEQAVLLRHLQRRGYTQAQVRMHRPGIHRIDYGHAEQPLVSLVVPCNGRFDHVQRCVHALIEKTRYPHFEILLVNDGSSSPATRAWLDGLVAREQSRVSVLNDASVRDHATACNLAARHAQGEYLVLLHEDTVIVHDDWLDALLNHGQRPEVGIVGARLMHPNGMVEQAVQVLGLNGPGNSAFSGLPQDEGYMRRLELDQNVSAVSGACLLIRRALYLDVGGMDERLVQRMGASLDLCLKARQAGYLTVWTPHAVLVCEGQGEFVPAEAVEAEQDALYGKWLPVIARDPAYNRNLSLQGAGFELETDPGLSWNPLSWRPLPVLLSMPGELAGTARSRVVDPALSMSIAGLADVRLALRPYLPAELERLQPDSWVMRRPASEAQIDALRRNARFSRAFKVGEVNADLPGLADDDLAGALRWSAGVVDRLVVPTPALAEALQGFCADIRVMPDRLHPARWGALATQRQPGSRPRIGWVGDQFGASVQRLMLEIVQALRADVDWVCLGECPPPLRPYLREIHGPVPYDDYPQKLMSLGLDLALAPLGDGWLDACRSNVRLLEYAACGYPVVCSDVLPYQGLPVTRVRNTADDWVSAIQAHLAEPAASAKGAQALREQVLARHMLDEGYARQWLDAWLPG
ncbi:glycosyltransferase [Pseudomonas kurunegalensis]|uniref:glycosyltransferase n=1 Tax=Pseudomonas kurunegalensis TaxID=485880 RepID=UPI002363C704|nr:glycosyltransferase [Pseudomonas kurunegalensis]MDD2134401.1 glycosyltransferase [Pseudomonas kurunegalensis]